MNATRAVLVGSTSSIFCFGLLFLTYPWSTYYANFSYGARITIVSYLLLALIVGVVVGVVVGLSSFSSSGPRPSRFALTGILSFASLVAMSLLLGPGGVDIFGIRIRGIFFSEWKFVIFDVFVALPVSLLDASLIWWIASRKQQ